MPEEIPPPPPFLIRLANVPDAFIISKLLHDSFLEYEPLYTPQGFAATTPDAKEVFLRMQEGPVWIAFCAGEPVGTVAAVVEDGSLHIRGMAVLPAARKAKIGSRLLEQTEAHAAEQDCERLFLSTTPFLEAAIRLYEKFGFRRVQGSEHDLFGTPLFTMEKHMS
jgi:ribosomal protein S18 acetylase RimI-like enzyme